MLAHNPSPSNTRNHPRHDAPETTILELTIEGEAANDWLMQLLSAQEEFFGKQAFSDNFRHGKTNPDLAVTLSYLHAIRSKVQDTVKAANAENNPAKLTLTVTLER